MERDSFSFYPLRVRFGSSPFGTYSVNNITCMSLGWHHDSGRGDEIDEMSK